MTANGTGAAPVRLSALVAPGGERELSIARIGARTRDIQMPGPELTNQPSTTQDLGTTRRGLEVRQTLLVHLNSIPLPARSQNLVVTNLFGGPCILATLDEGVAAFDFSNPHRPVLVGSWRIEGVRGALNWQGALLVFGQEGVEWIDRSGRRSGTVAKCELSSILDAAGDRQALYALTDEGVDVYSKRLCRIGAVPLEGGQCLARVGRTLVAGARRGLTIFETAKPRHLRGERFLEDTSVRAARSTLVGEAGTFVVVPEDGTAQLLRFNQERLEEIARYSGTPWFIETVRLGDCMVKIGADRMSLDTYRFGESSVI
jgi:hypothetical protein